jgi:RHS repeat-associated protein
VLDNGKINNYDLSGKLISVNDGNKVIEYIYLGNAKIAMVNDDSIDTNVYFAHNNYMNMPRLFTDEYKNVVWSGDFTPFGELYNEYGSISNVIRFTGQYKNIESEYFYNYFRDYEAGLGRYLQSDPIGLNGGINTYAYVGGNPVNYTDPLGLYYLGISTKVVYSESYDDGFFDFNKFWRGTEHVWLDIYNDEGIIVNTMGNNPGDSVQLDYEFNNSNYIGYDSYIVDISNEQYKSLWSRFEKDSKEVEYKLVVSDCVNWAINVFDDITGVSVNSWLPKESPKSVSKWINDSNKGYYIYESNYLEKRTGR